MKRIAVGLVVAAGLAVPATGSAHVHGITPLLGLSCHVPATAGANQADFTPAAEVNGGPIPTTGLIPSVLGNSPLTVGDGGFGATTANC
jgi:hypothetical protein